MTALGAIGEGLVELSLPSSTAPPQLASGGDAANVCVMAARLGASVRLGGRVGADALGDRLVTFWNDNGLDLGGLATDRDAATGLYINEVHAGEHRFTYWRRGSAGSRLAPGDLPPAFFEGLGVLVVTGVTLAVSASSARAALAAAETARERGTKVACVLNHRPALGGDVDALAAFARECDIVIGSLEDAAAIFATEDPARLHAVLGGELVMTDGGRPAVVLDRAVASSQPIPPVTVRNAAGAGDALAGAYLAARLRGDSQTRSLAWGVAAATLSVQREGCAASYPTADETAALLRQLPPAVPIPIAGAPA